MTLSNSSGVKDLAGKAERLAAAADIPPLIVGLTVVAFGASSPQIAVMAQVAFGGQLVLIIGNVVQGYGRIAYHSPCQSTCSATSISRALNPPFCG